MEISNSTETIKVLGLMGLSELETLKSFSHSNGETSLMLEKLYFKVCSFILYVFMYISLGFFTISLPFRWKFIPWKFHHGYL